MRVLIPLLLLAGCVDPPRGQHRDPPARSWNLGGLITDVGALRMAVHPHWYAYTNYVEWGHEGIRSGNTPDLCLSVVALDDQKHSLGLSELVMEPTTGDSYTVSLSFGVQEVARTPVSLTLRNLLPDVQKLHRGRFQRIRIRGTLDGQSIDFVAELADGSGGLR